MALLNEITESAPLLALTVTIIIAVIQGAKVVYKYMQQRNLAILNRRIDNCFNVLIKDVKDKLEKHGTDIQELKTNVDNILDFFVERRRRRVTSRRRKQ